jgi:hypothetical protein
MSLKVGSYLNLRNTPITSLPEGLQVRGSLDLENCKNLTSLPKGLKVDYLNLRNTPITSLPDDLQVRGYLDLRDTPITSLPRWEVLFI